MSTLNRTADTATPPVRLVHLGLGAFHRAHQVWYTQQAEADPATPQWGYASFTGRSRGAADLLKSQDGLFTLVTRSGAGDDFEVISSLVDPAYADDTAHMVELLARPEVAVVTLTVTEAGYHLAEDGTLLHDADVTADLAALKDAVADPTGFTGTLRTAAGKIVLGLAARRAAGAGGLAVMSCDNVADNGPLTRGSVCGFARELDADLADWIEQEVTFPSTSIDRITPATDDSLIADVKAATGVDDSSPVVTEPFASWVIEGEFPAGRPDWEKAGVEFVDEIEEFERRKLWLLNGSHSLMAYYAQLRGHATVAEAIGDAEVRARVEALWDEAANHLQAPELKVPEYRASLTERFENPRIRHNLVQIATDGGTKQRMRAVPIMKAELAEGRDGAAAAFSIAAWIAYLLREGATQEIKDTRAEELARARSAADPVRSLIAALDEELAGTESAVALIRSQVESIQR
ncbi:mannitol dehydrogenase family protein [Corynebacterium guangdongense]|uniref:Fructuronate reductase n=1 Tax=Corynebacterium guangdongense TaxID=1783348 RepID=A0ABU2A0I3_9CORY|nr:mannitol dehydrogenase family protein [Corynebacterium guangdongense]MDR7330148.1 fructuronate reductase [Corynebacterium guangdongense]WJZ18706.1 Polyol:NADP oxidoreductase [Corynebacterium guangdongense]